MPTAESHAQTHVKACMRAFRFDSIHTLRQIKKQPCKLTELLWLIGNRADDLRAVHLFVANGGRTIFDEPYIYQSPTVSEQYLL